jgi:hypothetical protein
LSCGLRRAGVERELAALADLGLDAVEVDLRRYVTQQDRLRRDLAGATLAWLRGRVYGSRPVWDGLGLLAEAFVPHYRSPGHPETAAMELVVSRYRAEGTAYRTLHDGQALLVNGPDTVIV